MTVKFVYGAHLDTDGLPELATPQPAASHGRQPARIMVASTPRVRRGSSVIRVVSRGSLRTIRVVSRDGAA